MTSDERDIKNENLEFFDSIFFKAHGLSFDDRDSWWLVRVPLLHAINLVEVGNWLRLGVDLDFFDAESVIHKSFSIPHQSLGLVRNDFLRAPKYETSGLFDNPELLKEDVQRDFLSYLLLTGEVLFEPSTMFFLESIGAISDELWQIRLDGSDLSVLPADLYAKRLDGSDPSIFPGDLYTGFANHLRYLEQLWQFGQRHTLDRQIRRIINARIFINRSSAKLKCFEFGGDVIAMRRQSGPEWSVMRRSAFDTLYRITESESSHDPVMPDLQERDRLWSIFERHSNGSGIGKSRQRSQEASAE